MIVTQHIAHTNRQLIAAMMGYQLKRNEVKELLNVSRQRIDNWLLPEDSPHWRRMPEPMLELLQIKLRDLPKNPDQR